MPLTEKDVAFAARALRLKRTVRAGWTRVPGLKDPESVAEHSFGVALLAFLAAARDPTLNSERLLRIALAHDVPEAAVGDLTPRDVSDAMAKHDIEARGLEDLFADLDYEARAPIAQAWMAYEDGDSREARLVADLDKLEMALQARTYAGEGADEAALREFFASAIARIEDPVLKALAEALGTRSR